MASRNERLELKVKIAEEENAFNSGIMKFGDLSPFTCPECSGVLKAIKDGTMERYRCHTGHAFSAASLFGGYHGRRRGSLILRGKRRKRECDVIESYGRPFC